METEPTETCASILNFTMKLCVVMPGASYDKCVNVGVREFNQCTLSKLKQCLEDCNDQDKST